MKLWFIWSTTEKCYLGISVSGNQGDNEFSGSYTCRLIGYGTPHPFASEDKAKRVLSEDTPWYNTSIEIPSREGYTVKNCKIIGMDLPKPD